MSYVLACFYDKNPQCAMMLVICTCYENPPITSLVFNFILFILLPELNKLNLLCYSSAREARIYTWCDQRFASVNMAARDSERKICDFACYSFFIF